HQHLLCYFLGLSRIAKDTTDQSINCAAQLVVELPECFGVPACDTTEQLVGGDLPPRVPRHHCSHPGSPAHPHLTISAPLAPAPCGASWQRPRLPPSIPPAARRVVPPLVRRNSKQRQCGIGRPAGDVLAGERA